MKVKEKIINELDLFKENELSEILDFIEFLKIKHAISDVTLASECILAKDWLSPEEDKTWEHL
ncbi:MAG TPA: DUF2281 domain-containing protein [Thermotogota bacterium]|nr:DUF2281 domain-containing protein [Thermotogota bacterium]HRW34896.1 DUF2281 domain-containing protein [Thermotogota bacterium]